jgi:hypothetical protein
MAGNQSLSGEANFLQTFMWGNMNIFNIKRNLLGASLMAGLAIGASAPAFAMTNLVQNGTFTSHADWSMVSDSVESNRSNIYGLSCQNSSCTNAEVLANHSPDTLYQIISGLQVGKTYDLTYLFGGRLGYNAQLYASFGGQEIAGSPISGHEGEWVSESFLVNATAATETLSFTASTLSGYGSAGAEITNVSLTAAVPEASTWVMMLTGFAGLGLVSYRQRRNAVAAA